MFAESRHLAPEMLALWAAAVTAVVKEFLYRVSMRAGMATNSPTLLASARDHRADVLASLVASAGIGISILGLPSDALSHVASALMIARRGA